MIIIHNLDEHINEDFEKPDLWQSLYTINIIIYIMRTLIDWSEPLRVDNELSNINSWREAHEKDEAALRPRIQDISSSRT